VDVDAVVIGSGAGGLTAAVALARAGRSVLVLEQHYLPGGWCHSFDLGGYRFSPGVHYLGELAPGGRMRRLFEGLGLGADLELCELNPDGLDHVLVGGERFDIPRGKARLAERLAARFPGEAAGIRRYLDAAGRVGRELETLMALRLRDLPLLPFRAPTVLRWGLSSLASMLDAHVRDPRLKAILAAQCGDHGLPPSMAPAALHCAVASHYFEGGFYPRGGGAAIPRAMIRALRRAGGAIRVKAPVERILVERRGLRRRAIGVRLADGTEVRARTVISNADPHMTFERLVGREHLPLLLRARLAATRWSVSAISLFLAVDMDVRAAGLDSGNVWFYESPDLDGIYGLGLDARSLDLETIPGLFLTATTLKDPTKMRRGHHTLEAFAFVPWGPFSAWAASRQGDRPEGYKALKRELQARMLRAVGRIVPGIERRVVFADLGTPLTNAHYVAASFGNLYGTEKSRLQVGPFAFQVGTAIDGLLLCGASTLSHGVFGAALSGLVAAARVAGCAPDDLLAPGGASIPIYPSEDLARWPEPLRRKVEALRAGAAAAREPEAARA
jgi:phytoene dehydrogenase-like protein